MRRLYNIIIGVTFALLLTACGKQGKAESLVKAFIEQNAEMPDKMKTLSFGKIDSTKVISDSLIMVLQTREHELFRKDINYTAHTAGRMLYYVRMKYAYGNDTLQQTFYMDESLEQIVAFK